jgi:hypothetical protein
MQSYTRDGWLQLSFFCRSYVIKVVAQITFYFAFHAAKQMLMQQQQEKSLTAQ